jgi:sugar lactone lactonase YvrE
MISFYILAKKYPFYIVKMKDTYIKIIAFSISLIMLSSGCSKTTTSSSNSAPSVVTNNVILNVTSTTAQSGGTVTSDGGQIISANGVCYSATNQTPTLTDSKTTDAILNYGITTSSYVSNLSSLVPNTTYYVRAYATNSSGTGYGAVIKFTTSSNLLAINTTVSTLAGSGAPGYAEGSGTSAIFNNPQGILVDAGGNVYVSDTYNNNIRKITPQGTTSLIAGNGVIGLINGSAASAQFYAPQGLAFDANNNLYVADAGNNVIRKITQNGNVSTFAGNGLAGFHDGSGPLYSYFKNPSAIAFDAKGSMYIADRSNNVIRKVTAAGLDSTIAGSGNGSPGYADSTGTSAAFRQPNALVIDANGNLYVADQGNSAIRKVTPAGVVTTVAGGPTQSSILINPTGLAIDKTGNLFIADESGRVLEYTTNNVLYVLAGSSTNAGNVNGAGTIATFNQPINIAVDANGNIYIADKGNNCIRKLVISNQVQ